MIKETKLENGIRVVTRYIPTVKTVSVGVFVGAGSRHETSENNGVAHFLEHMAFKGTQTRSVEDLAYMIEGVGGQMNAYTSYEITAYHCRLMSEDISVAVDFLSDIICHSVFNEDEMEKERGAILQEIMMYKDTPDDVVVENLRALQYPNHPVGRPILGTVENVKNMSPEDLKRFVDRFYVGSRMVVCAAGDVDHDAFCLDVAEKFASIKKGEMSENLPPQYHVGEVQTSRLELEQVYLALAWKGVGILHEDHYTYSLLGSLLGQGMTSKLWQEVREKRGLAYSIYAGNTSGADYGAFTIYAETSLEKLEEIQQVIQNVIETAVFSEKDLCRAKKMLSSSLAMSLESCEAQMEYIANHTLAYGYVKPIDEILARAEAVTLDDIERVRKGLFKTALKTSSLVGPFLAEGAH